MIYQHIKSDINDTKRMLQNRQTNTMSPPGLSDRSGQSGADGDERSRRQGPVQVKVFPESPASILNQNEQDRRVLSLCLHLCKTLFEPYVWVLTWQSVAYCLPLQLSGGEPVEGKSTEVEGWRWGRGFALHCTLRQHRVKHGTQEGANTPNLECDVWNVRYMECGGGVR